MRPTVLNPRPALLLAIAGGALGTMLMTALFYSAPLFGMPELDYPRWLGGIFSADPDAALGVGYALLLLLGSVALPSLLYLLWDALPGHGVSFGGAFAKGTIFGLGGWVLSGLLLPIFGLLGRLPEQEMPAAGLFAMTAGLAGFLLLLLAHVVYGVVTAVVGAGAQGIAFPLDLIGWHSHVHGDFPEVSTNWVKRPQQRSGRL